MSNLKEQLFKLKLNILKFSKELVMEKSAIEKVALRRNEPPKVDNAPLLIVNRKVKKIK